MYICVCQAVTDGQIAQAVANGAKNLRDLRRDLEVGSACGRCMSSAIKCLRSAKSEARQAGNSVAA